MVRGQKIAFISTTVYHQTVLPFIKYVTLIDRVGVGRQTI